MKFSLYFLFALLACHSAFAQSKDVSNTIQHHQTIGYILDIRDFRPETLEVMRANRLQGGGATWIVLVETALKRESPSTLALVELQDEADVLRVTSRDKQAITTVQALAWKMMEDSENLQQHIEAARKTGHLE